LGSATASASNLVLDGGTLQYTGVGSSTDRLFTLTLNGGTIDGSGSGALTWTGGGSSTSIATSGSGARTLSFTGSYGTSSSAANIFTPIIVDGGGATSVVMKGSGYWSIAGATTNTYTGTTTISNGALVIATDGNLGAAASNIILSGGGELLIKPSAAVTINRNITLGAGGGEIDNGSSTAANTVKIAGTISGTTTVNSVVYGNPLVVGTDNQGILILSSGSNAISGTVMVNSGTLRLDSSGILGTTVNLMLNNANFDFPNALTLGSLQMSGTSTITNSNTTSSNALTVTGTSTLVGTITTYGLQTYMGDVTIGAPILPSAYYT
jgi:autotransporter-associated beta strand protein